MHFMVKSSQQKVSNLLNAVGTVAVAFGSFRQPFAAFLGLTLQLLEIHSLPSLL
jgi:hypothetical protein